MMTERQALQEYYYSKGYKDGLAKCKSTSVNKSVKKELEMLMKELKKEEKKYIKLNIRSFPYYNLYKIISGRINSVRKRISQV